MTGQTDQEVKGEGSATGGLVAGLCTLVLQLWKMLGGPVSLPDIMEKVIPQDAWGDVGLGIIDAERLAPKAWDQVCDRCRRTGFKTFQEAWEHKVECIPEVLSLAAAAAAATRCRRCRRHWLPLLLPPPAAAAVPLLTIEYNIGLQLTAAAATAARGGSSDCS